MRPPTGRALARDCRRAHRHRGRPQARLEREHGATTYSLFEGSAGGGESTTLSERAQHDPVSLTGLTPGKQYFFKLHAVNAGGNSTVSKEGTVMTTANPPTDLRPPPATARYRSRGARRRREELQRV